MAFYLKHVMKLPERTHPKTLLGSLLHNTIEYVLKPKRRKTLDTILEKGFSYDDHPSLDRYGKMWRDHYKIEIWDRDEMEGMLRLCFETIKPYLNEREFQSEQRFELQVGGATISGYIDIVAIAAEKILDFKTKGSKFTKKELPHNIQAGIYQLYYYKKYGKLVPTEFIMTRFPPTKFKKDKHIQRVEAPTVARLNGLEKYLEFLYHRMNNFTLDDARKNYCDDYSFCDRVCQFRRGFTYYSVKKKETDELVGNYLLDNPPQVPEDCYMETRTFLGCPKFNQQ
jgi:hypothetical protein